MKMKKLMAVILAGAMVMGMAACGSSDDKNSDSGKAQGAEDTDAAGSDTAAMEGEIAVVTREDGSGTRGAFIELFGIEEKNADGEKEDMTTQTASVTNNTSVMMTTVAGDSQAIGYISLGSLDESQVKALKIDGAEATAENVSSGTYKVARPFNIVTTGAVSELAQDFINFIMSADGQQVIEDEGYIKVSDAAAYTGGGKEGKIVVAGSSSVTPVMEKLKEAYVAKNSGVEIEVQQSDSTTGVTSALDGICDIGMASRELKDSEVEAGAQGTVIAQDGIAVIVNKENPISEMTSDQVKSIYKGETTDWSEIQ
ncbi:MAG TPA: substrate-binding domain-containing protein [Candidatus Egerieimonas intestinavium]|uniref:Substrate-binding domain-containing protein n=1 Tax=Candidatus Egerieimonas intestinavium TaxID=2840777 RepID=A0A9D1EKZ1_9FIRM|nr:substrate-binding domain-containing protein [Candidatus Egerieimonas intestinavium]